MNHIPTKRMLFWGVLGVVIVLGVILTTQYFKRTYVVAITVQNVSSYEVYQKNTSGKTTLIKKVQDAVNSNIRLRRSESYTLSYKGASGYADGSATLTGSSLSIDPDYSDSHIKEILSKERQSLVAVITAYNENIPSLYVVDAGTLYKKGQYYITTLTPIDLQSDNDVNVVLLEKQGNTWKMVVPPTIILTKDTKPSAIPDDVIAFANTYRQIQAQAFITQQASQEGQ